MSGLRAFFMRKQDKVILWPAYFDSTKTRTEGRRVPKNLTVPSPRLEELQRATEQIGLGAEAVLEAKYPSAPWQKVGAITVPKRGSKTQTIRGVAKEILAMRGLI